MRLGYNRTMIEQAEKGHLHPLSQVITEAVAAFREFGFEVADGPELEDEFHNFDALNIPESHPSRDMQDTFWLKDLEHLLRTQTSAVQPRYMENNQPPLRMVTAGKVFRSEATDARHEAQFFQIESLVVDKNITVANMKSFIELFLKRMFGDNIQTRLRPSFFPFVEPGFEVDMLCFNCGGVGQKNDKQCSLCGGSGWIEIAGAGLVHPNVFKSVGIDPEEWSGFAFAFGLDRVAMLKWGIDDIRLFSSGDLRFLKQF